VIGVQTAQAQTSSFSYQGKLVDGGVLANGVYDFEFRIFTAGGVQLSSVIRDDVSVTDGVFTVILDYGSSIFPGADRFLEIGVRPGASTGTFTTLSPRQQFTSTPYAIKSLAATSADSLSCVNCVTSGQINSVSTGQITGVLATGQGGTGLSSSGSAGNYLRSNGSVWTASSLQASDLPSGNANYIQNTAVQQASSNFNISGSGTVGGTLSAGGVNATSFNLSGNGTAAGTLSAGVVNATTQYNLGGSRALSNAGTANLFAGAGAGVFNTGSFNSFFGSGAGASNTSGAGNSFFGGSSGNANTIGFNNSFFGTLAGSSNGGGGTNSFFGHSSGQSNTSGGGNTYVGYSAGRSNSTASFNSFFGESAGISNLASGNSFFGYHTGMNTTGGTGNSFFGYRAGLNNIGANNSYFGYDAGQAGAGASTQLNAFFGYQAGMSNTSNSNAFFGGVAGQANTTGTANAFFGTAAGLGNTTGSSNTFIGDGAGESNTSGSNNTFVGAAANIQTGSAFSFATAIGSGAIASSSNTVVLGRSVDAVRVPGSMTVVGTLTVTTLGAASALTVCRTGSNMIASCSSSRRYKDHISPLASGIELVNRLRPVTFNWKTTDEPDLGLIAEEVAEVEPLLITRNAKGEIEGVKYTQLTAVLINAIKQQQEQIRQLQKALEEMGSKVARRRSR
jgi:hypothetical protein